MVEIQCVAGLAVVGEACHELAYAARRDLPA